MTAPSDTPTRVEMAAAIRDAATAARTGQPLSVCPYKPADGQHADRLARVWVRTYLRVRPAVGTSFDYMP